MCHKFDSDLISDYAERAYLTLAHKKGPSFLARSKFLVGKSGSAQADDAEGRLGLEGGLGRKAKTERAREEGGV